MSLPEIVSPEEWRAARVALLEREKAHTRARDALAADRRRLPMVRVTKDYRFTGREGEVDLRGLFGDHQQLIVGHFMFDPAWDAGCSSCSAGVDERGPGHFAHLAVRDTRLVYVSRAPLAKLDAWQREKGWDIPWYSSGDGDFNYDFGVTVDAARRPPEYNYRADAEEGEYPGTSAFLRVGDDVFHTYSSYARAAEDTAGSYQLLDLTALGRQEDWEEPKGRSEAVRSGPPDFSR